MNIFYYIFVGILFVVWFVGYIIFGLGAFIHLVFLVAVAILVYTLYLENKKT